MRQQMETIYKFEELPEKVQDKIIQEYGYTNVDSNWWDYLYEGFKEDLNNVGLDADSFEWDLERGNYFKMCKAGVNDKNKLLEAASCSKYNILAELNNWDICIGIIEPSRYGENECEVIVENDDNEEENEEMDNFTRELEENINDFLENLCSKFLKTLKDEYEYLTSEKGVKDMLEANDYEFYEDGSRA